MADGCSLTVAVASAFTLTFTLTVVTATHAHTRPPHIVIILADDLGWNDVGFHGSDQIPTPNIDALAYNGVILNNHYTPPLCTPSRSSFMTGKYPIHIGMQHLVIFEAEPRGLPLEERLLPEYLRQAGYRTHAVGKWHLGFYKREYTPLYRGFDTHYGYYQGFQDYYDHSVKATFLPFVGYDMRRNLTVDWSARGKYSTDVFTEEAVRLISEHDTRTPMFLYLAHLAPHAGTTREPFQAPDEEIARFPHIKDPERRTYAGMVSRLDHSVGEVVSALRARAMLDNSIIVFMSDNGAPTHGIHSNRGSNFPLRGIKETPWEGGVRTVSAIWSPLIKKRQRASNQLMHMTDWLPTLYSAAGQNVSELGNIDGIDLWSALVEDTESPRSEFVYNIDDIGDVYAAIRYKDWKYIRGQVHKGIADDWYGEAGREEPGLEYDIHSVLSSKTGAALAGYTTRQQIRQKYQPQNETSKEGLWDLPSAKTVLRLRQASQLTCTQPIVTCRPKDSACLFNIREDPCERQNLADRRPDVLSFIENILNRYRETMVPASNLPNDPMGDPAFWNHTWVYWQDSPETEQEVGQGMLDGPQMVREVLTTASILVSMVVLVTLVLRLSPQASLMFKPPFGPAEEKRKRQLNSAHEPAEKANLTYTTSPPPY